MGLRGAFLRHLRAPARRDYSVIAHGARPEHLPLPNLHKNE